MGVPFADLKSAVDATRRVWSGHLEELYQRSAYILGQQLEAFEREFASALAARFAVGVSSGSGAIEVSLRELGIVSPRQQVLTSALTAPFTAVSIVAAGATPAFADIDPETLLISPDDTGNRITRKAAALLPVHLYGQPCRIRDFAELAKSRDLALVQDACQAHGARYLNRHPLTRYSAHVAYSFYPTKNLGALGDGGAIATDRAGTFRRLRMFRDGGRRGGQVSYVAGINSRLDEMQCCYLRAFLPHLETWNRRRQQIAARYDAGLRDTPGLELVKRYPCSVCHLYVVRAARRDRLRTFLAARGIATGIHYPVPLHLNPAFAGCGLKKGDLPHAEKACRQIVSLPIGPFLNDSQVDEVVERVREFYRR
jgi:dTDP-3-amino-3,4,6-trideoxy-alpha-D-glucose transaminase